MTAPEFLTVAEVAEKLRIGKMTVYRLIQTEELRAYRVRNSFRIRPRDADDYLRRCNTIAFERGPK